MNLGTDGRRPSWLPRELDVSPAAYKIVIDSSKLDDRRMVSLPVGSTARTR
jgi:hypothetical protein